VPSKTRRLRFRADQNPARPPPHRPVGDVAADDRGDRGQGRLPDVRQARDKDARRSVTQRPDPGHACPAREPQRLEPCLNVGTQLSASPARNHSALRTLSGFGSHCVIAIRPDVARIAADLRGRWLVGSHQLGHADRADLGAQPTTGSTGPIKFMPPGRLGTPWHPGRACAGQLGPEVVLAGTLCHAWQEGRPWPALSGPRPGPAALPPRRPGGSGGAHGWMVRLNCWLAW
jgi:hypothetical protein